jgi:branched-chain amino acid transport system substrate-binding protein
MTGIQKEKTPMKTVPYMKLIVVFALVVILPACDRNQVILIGFSGELTGKNGSLGVQARNGAQLAVEIINADDGINGRKIELVVRDDKGIPDGAKAADQELVNAGVVAIIGHITSTQTLAAYPISGEAGIVLCSPTASTPELSSREDHFFRVVAANPKEGKILAKYLFEQRKKSRVAVIYESDNTAFTQSLLESFTAYYEALGGTIGSAISFSSSTQSDFAKIVEELKQSEPDGLLIIAAAIDVALIAQQVLLSEWELPLLATAWAQTEELIHKGGKAVEGIIIPLSYDPNNTSPSYKDFQARYEKRFGSAPTLYAGHAYDIVFLLEAALEKTNGKADGVAQALVEQAAFKGVGGTIAFDRYGEVERDWFLLSVKDGQFVTTGRLAPQKH